MNTGTLKQNYASYLILKVFILNIVRNANKKNAMKTIIDGIHLKIEYKMELLYTIFSQRYDMENIPHHHSTFQIPVISDRKWWNGINFPKVLEMKWKKRLCSISHKNEFYKRIFCTVFENSLMTVDSWIPYRLFVL